MKYALFFVTLGFLMFSGLAFADITSPNDGDYVANTATDFTLSGTGNRFVLFGPDELWICSDNLSAPYGTQSIDDLDTACGGGSLSTFGNGAYHILWTTGYSAPDCETTAGNYTDCLGSGVYNNQDICLNVGIADACDSGPPAEGSTGGATSTVDQVHENVFHGFIIFFISFWFGMNLLRRRI